MQKNKKNFASVTFWRGLSIKTAFILISIFSVVVASVLTKWITKFAMIKLMEIADENGFLNNVELFGYIINPALYGDVDLSVEFGVYKVIYTYATLIVFPICIIMGAFLFYWVKLQVPLDLLIKASKEISKGNLDFDMDYSKLDEFTPVCNAFESMRTSVKDNNEKMQNLAEERRRLNSAFAHDLRTPLTVMRGNVEMLLDGIPEQTISLDKEIHMIKTIDRHIDRLEKYTYSMSSIQKLEELEINLQEVDISSFFDIIKTDINTYVEQYQKNVNIISKNLPDKLMIDSNIIMQVVDNILSNSVRYCKTKIDVTISYINNYFIVIVKDDGVGFSQKEIEMATKPFYKGRDTSADSHFGLGLYISKLLCQKHKGDCILSNHNGAVVTAKFFTKK